jgi:hypothetical protein
MMRTREEEGFGCEWAAPAGRIRNISSPGDGAASDKSRLAVRMLRRCFSCIRYWNGNKR